MQAIAVEDQRSLHAIPLAEAMAPASVDVQLLPISELLKQPQFIRQWSELAKRSSEPNPFSEKWYLEAACNALGHDASVDILTVVSKEEMVGIMPIHVADDYAHLPLVHMRNWLNHNAFLGTPLVAKGFETLFWKAVLASLDRRPNGALFLHLAGMAVDGVIAGALEAECEATGRRYASFLREKRALLERGLSPDAYLEATMRGKKRKELRRQQSRLSEVGQLEFHRLDGREGLDSWIDEFLALERRGWKGTNGSALDCNDETRDLFRGALHGAANEGKLELLALRLDGRPIAMLVNFLTPPGAFSFKTAFDEDYARYSPGVLLQIHNLALLEHEGIDWCDSCAAQDHPMIDSIWSGRRAIGRYSVAIGGPIRRTGFAILLAAEKAKGRLRQINPRKIHKTNEMSS